MQHLVAMSVEPGVQLHERWRFGEAMRHCGWEYREQAAAVLRRAHGAVAATVNTRLWAARELYDLGPDYRAEAVRHLMRLSEATSHRHAVNWERESALGVVARCDESLRSRAVDTPARGGRSSRRAASKCPHRAGAA